MLGAGGPRGSRRPAQLGRQSGDSCAETQRMSSKTTGGGDWCSVPSVALFLSESLKFTLLVCGKTQLPPDTHRGLVPGLPRAPRSMGAQVLPMKCCSVCT